MASYIDRSLGDGETIIARARFHPLYVLAAWVALLLPCIVFGSAIALYLPHGDATGQAVAGISALLLLIAFFAGLIRLAHIWTTEIGVTSHRFVEKYGLFSLRTNEIALPNIEGVRMNQSFLGRVFGYGTIRIEGTGVDAVTTPTIADPVGFVRAIQTAKEHVAGR